jgi:Dihaem cytochrome c
MRHFTSIIFMMLLSLPACAIELSKLPSVANANWAARCGDCHVLYHPGLLPERSWRKIMASPKRHFGRNIGTRPVDASVTEFLVANSADQSSHPISVSIAASISLWETPESISATGWFAQVHRKLPKVEHFHQCRDCHQFAANGDFRVIHAN